MQGGRIPEGYLPSFELPYPYGTGWLNHLAYFLDLESGAVNHLASPAFISLRLSLGLLVLNICRIGAYKGYSYIEYFNLWIFKNLRWLLISQIVKMLQFYFSFRMESFILCYLDIFLGGLNYEMRWSSQ